MKYARIVNGRLIKDCDDYVDLECEDYYRKVGKDTVNYKRINCKDLVFSKTEYFAAVSAKKTSEQLINQILTFYPKAKILAINENTESIAREEGLDDILKSVKKLIKIEFTVFSVINECNDECDC